MVSLIRKKRAISSEIRRIAHTKLSRKCYRQERNISTRTEKDGKKENDVEYLPKILEYFCINKIIAAGKCVYVIQRKSGEQEQRDVVVSLHISLSMLNGVVPLFWAFALKNGINVTTTEFM